MKTLSTIAAAFLMMISLNSFAVDKASTYAYNVDHNAKKYISSVTRIWIFTRIANDVYLVSPNLVHVPRAISTDYYC